MLQHTLLAFRKCYASLGETLRFVCLFTYMQSTLRRPAVENMRKALYVQYSGGLMVYYGVSIVGYWAYGSTVSEYLPKELSGPKWVKILVNAAVFVQSVVSQHMFIAPVHEALDTKFLKLDESLHSRENIKRLFCVRASLFTGNTLVTAAFPFMGDFVKGKIARIEKKVWHWTNIVLFSLLAIATTISAVRLIVNNVRVYHFFADT
ncbi:hypothetical protein C3L33_00613, partial [Rhododendron williamsianum]